MVYRLALALLLSAVIMMTAASAQADLFTINRYSNANVLVSETLYTAPNVATLNWNNANNANVVSLNGWGTVAGAEWISELPGYNGPAASYRVYHIEITLPANSENLSGRLDYMVDDYLWFYVNQDLAAQNTTYGNWNRLGTIDFTSALASGLTSIVLDLVVKNSGTSGSNPLGASFHVSLGGDTNSAVPEPGSILLLASGLAGMAGWRRRGRRRRKQLP